MEFDARIPYEKLQGKHVVLGLSGGVDSSVSAALLKENGMHVTALFMKNWEEDDTNSYCAAAKDREDAQKVCDKLGIELKTINFAAEYWDNVFEIFLSEYKEGRTPNPDILCNKEIKFKAFMQYAMEVLNADYIERVLFPVGDIEKPQVRAIADKLGLATAKKKDSTGICFIGEKRFHEFLSKYIPAKPGLIRTVDGKVVGKHDGLMYATIGQRKGLHIGGTKDGNGKPWYVVEKDIKNNELIVAEGNDDSALYSVGLEAVHETWITECPTLPFECTCKIRYRQPDVECIVTRDGDRLIVKFKKPVAAVAPGQSVVFYQGMDCLGGAVIDRHIKEN